MQNRISNDVWASRIANSTKSGLVVITYEIILHNIDLCLQCINNKDDKNFDKYLDTAKDFLKDLMANLNMEYEISNELLRLYLFVNEKLIRSGLRHKAEHLEDAKKILSILLPAFKTASESQSDEPVMKNTQQIYAGLTYSKNSLNENTNYSEKRGFKA